MDANVVPQSETTMESGSSHDSVPEQIFLDGIEPNKHGRVHYQLLELHRCIIMIVSVRVKESRGR